MEKENRKIAIMYILDGTEHQEVIEISENKTYTFSDAIQQTLNFLSKKYGWKGEEITELRVKLFDKDNWWAPRT